MCNATDAFISFAIVLGHVTDGGRGRGEDVRLMRSLFYTLFGRGEWNGKKEEEYFKNIISFSLFGSLSIKE